MEDLKRKLKELLIERLKFEDMTPDDIGDDEPLFAGGLGLDSIDALEIVVMLESEFGIKVKNESAARTVLPLRRQSWPASSSSASVRPKKRDRSRTGDVLAFLASASDSLSCGIGPHPA